MDTHFSEKIQNNSTKLANYLYNAMKQEHIGRIFKLRKHNLFNLAVCFNEVRDCSIRIIYLFNLSARV